MTDAEWNKLVESSKPKRGSKKPKLTPEQKKALADYNFRLREEDRYLGSVFANAIGQARVEAATKAAYDKCKQLGMTHEHGL